MRFLFEPAPTFLLRFADGVDKCAVCVAVNKINQVQPTFIIMIMAARASNINSMQYGVDDEWSLHIPALLIALFPDSWNKFKSV